MKIKIKVSPSETQDKTFTLSLKDFGMTKSDWEELNDDQKESIIDEYVGEMDQPYWNVRSFDEV